MQNRIINFKALKHVRRLDLSWHKYLRYLFSVRGIYLSTKSYDIIFISLSCKKLFSTRSIKQQKRSNNKVSAWLREYYFHQNLKFNLIGSKSFTIKYKKVLCIALAMQPSNFTSILHPAKVKVDWLLSILAV